LSIALIEHKRINTTLAKAKALRKHIEPLITKAKSNTTHSRRVVFSYLQNKTAVKELFGTVVDKIGDRPGGYVRIIKMGFRKSDGAEMAMIELVDFNELMLAAKASGDGKATKSKKRRTRRGKKSSAAAAAPAATTEAEVENADASNEEE